MRVVRGARWGETGTAASGRAGTTWRCVARAAWRPSAASWPGRLSFVPVSRSLTRWTCLTSRTGLTRRLGAAWPLWFAGRRGSAARGRRVRERVRACLAGPGGLAGRRGGPAGRTALARRGSRAGRSRAGRKRLAGVGQAGRKRLAGVGQAGRKRLAGVGQARRKRLAGIGQARRKRLTGIGQARRKRLTGIGRTRRKRLARVRRTRRERLAGSGRTRWSSLTGGAGVAGAHLLAGRHGWLTAALCRWHPTGSRLRVHSWLVSGPRGRSRSSLG